MIFDKISIKSRILSILIILTIIILGISASVYYIHSQMSNDGNVINIAGKQRMLIQKMTKEAFMVSAGYNESRKNLKETAELFDNTLNDLIEGNEAKGIYPAKGEIKSQLLYVKKLWEPFYNNIKIIYTKDPTDPEFKEALQYIYDHNMNILNEMNKAVELYSARYEEKVGFADNIVIVASVIALLIAIISIYVIRKTVLRQLDELRKITDELASKNYNVEPKVKFYNDEIGAIYQNIRKVLNNLKEDMLKQEKERNELNNLFNKISDAMNKVANGDLTARLEENGNRKEIAESINKAISNVANLIGELRDHVKRLDDEINTLRTESERAKEISDQVATWQSQGII